MSENPGVVFVDNVLSVAVHDDIVRLTMGRRGDNKEGSLQPALELILPKASVQSILRALSTIR